MMAPGPMETRLLPAAPCRLQEPALPNRHEGGHSCPLCPHVQSSMAPRGQCCSPTCMKPWAGPAHSQWTHSSPWLPGALPQDSSTPTLGCPPQVGVRLLSPKQLCPAMPGAAELRDSLPPFPVLQSPRPAQEAQRGWPQGAALGCVKSGGRGALLSVQLEDSLRVPCVCRSPPWWPRPQPLPACPTSYLPGPVSSQTPW